MARVKAAKNAFLLGKEYACAIAALKQSGILTLLPRSKKFGVIGIDGKEYLVPTIGHVRRAFSSNKELVARKRRQGFTKLQLTPMAMPIPRLIELAKAAILKHAAEGKIFRTKQKSKEANVPLRINADKTFWIWEKVRKALDTPGIVYFPQTYGTFGHHGLAKEEAIKNKNLCAVPGWSIGLIEPMAIMPKKGKGKTTGGRKQPEANLAPNDYLKILEEPPCQGETGWTPEDFLTYFITRLETTNQISHSREDKNASWLLGAFFPNAGEKYLERLVFVGYCVGGRLYLSVHRSANKFKCSVARSMVRLGG
jgi:hypothetical protein